VNLADRSALFWRPAVQSEFGGAMDGEGDDAKLTFAGNTSPRAEDKRHKRRPPGPERAFMIAGQRAAHPTAFRMRLDRPTGRRAEPASDAVMLEEKLSSICTKRVTNIRAEGRTSRHRPVLSARPSTRPQNLAPRGSG
jgi:hypothetical protein